MLEAEDLSEIKPAIVCDGENAANWIAETFVRIQSNTENVATDGKDVEHVEHVEHADYCDLHAPRHVDMQARYLDVAASDLDYISARDANMYLWRQAQKDNFDMASINGGHLCEALAQQKLAQNAMNNHWSGPDACIDTANIVVLKMDLNDPSSFLFDVSLMYQWHLLEHYSSPGSFRRTVMGNDSNHPDQGLMAYESRRYVLKPRRKRGKYDEGKRYVALLNASDILKFLRHKVELKAQQQLNKVRHGASQPAASSASAKLDSIQKEAAKEAKIKEEHDFDANPSFHKEPVLAAQYDDAYQKLCMVSDAVHCLYKKCDSALLMPEEPQSKRRRVRNTLANECKMLTFTACTSALKDLHAQLHAI